MTKHASEHQHTFTLKDKADLYYWLVQPTNFHFIKVKPEKRQGDKMKGATHVILVKWSCMYSVLIFAKASIHFFYLNSTKASILIYKARTHFGVTQ